MKLSEDIASAVRQTGSASSTHVGIELLRIWLNKATQLEVDLQVAMKRAASDAVIAAITRPISDSVNHPQHYGGDADPYEAIKVIEAWGLGFHLGSTLKYIRRAGAKVNDTYIQDIRKARWYLDRKIETLIGKPD